MLEIEWSRDSLSERNSYVFITTEGVGDENDSG